MKQITLLDGASGTRLWALSEAAGFAKKPSWTYNLEHPDFVAQVAREYAEAGSEIVFTNSFNANRQMLAGQDASVAEVVSAAVAAAKAGAGGLARVALDIGPLNGMMEPYGDLTVEEATEIFAEQIDAGMAAGADLIVLETFMDLEMLRCAVIAAKRYDVPVLASMTFQAGGRTMMGVSPADMVAALTPLGVDAVGLNCSLGPAEALPVLREFAAATDLPLIFKPNAGLPVTGPDGKVISPYTAETFAKESAPALELAGYVGACCGSSPDYIRAISRL